MKSLVGAVLIHSIFRFAISIVSYRNLLRLASSPLPFPLVQMGRTFTAVWTLSLPFVLIGDDFAEDSLSTFTFVILLTYGFLGLELDGVYVSSYTDYA